MAMEASEGREHISATPLPTLTVAAVARRLGVAPPTLRTWDRRYGLGPSAHTAGAHRRYSPADVARLLVMRKLTTEGVPPSQAARIALATPVRNDDGPTAKVTSLVDRRAEEALISAVDELDGAPPAPTGAAARARRRQAVARLDGTPARPRTEAVRDEDDPFSDADLRAARRAARCEAVSPAPTEELARELGEEVADQPWRDEPGFEIETPWLGVLRESGEGYGSAGGGRVVALPDGTPATRGLARAAMSLDTQLAADLLREAVRRHGVIPTWESMVTPVLRALGERFQATGDGIDVEHAFSEVLLGVLRDSAAPLARRNTAPVLLTCAENDHHTLPLHALAAALAEREVATRMLGIGLPAYALAAAVRRSGPGAVVLYAQLPGARATVVEELRRQRPAPRLILGGPGWLPGAVPPYVRRVASLAEAVEEILQVV